MGSGIGKRNRRVTFHRLLEGVDSANQSLGFNDTPAFTRWAEPKGETGLSTVRSAAQAGGINTQLNLYSFRINWTPTIDATMQMRDSLGTRYNITAVRHDLAMRNWTDVIVEVGGSNG
jgi:hypothetical protein